MLRRYTGAPSTGTTSSATGALLKVIQDQLAEERSSKSSLEGRATAVITTSSSLTTLLLGLSALAKSAVVGVPTSVRALLVCAVTAFVLACITAILAASPRAYDEFTVESLRSVSTPKSLSRPAESVEAQVATGLVSIIEAARTQNGRKATLLKRAVMFEVVGTALVGAAVAVVLLR